MPQNYIITAVEDTTFDPDQYGNKFFSIRLEGEKDSVLWKTKQRPQLGQVYGHIEPSRSGKSRLFKKDKLEEGASPQAGYSHSPRSPQAGKKSDDERSDDIRWGLCLKEANLYVTKYRVDLAPDQWAIEVNEYANALWKLSAGPDKSTVERVMGDILPDDEDVDDKIDLSKIPF